MAVLMRAAACAAAALLPGAAALRSRAPDATGKATYQVLSNNQDLQYVGDVTIGGQTITGIIDTGSFELVVFSKECSTCGIAGKYDPSESRTFAWGDQTELHSYGSGECTAADGFDRVSVEGMAVDHQALWLTKSCNMPALQAASFNAIVGIGPPGEPVITAGQELGDLEEELRKAEAAGSVPSGLLNKVAEAKDALHAAEAKPSLLEGLGVTAVSQCLGKPIGSPGMLIWNDDTLKARSGLPSVQRLQVVPDVFWGVASKDLGLDAQPSGLSAGCERGCYAIVDSGTSLLAAPSDIFADLFNAVETWMDKNLPEHTRPDCSDLSQFPNLVLTVDGQKLSLPPSSYMGSFVGMAKAGMEGFVRTNRFKKNGCHLLLMDLGFAEENEFGPMIILGMPFLREYYTTFDLGTSGPPGRSILVEKAGSRCEQAPSDSAVTMSKERGSSGDEELRERMYAYTPRRVDASKLHAPRWLGRSARARAKAQA